jgi:hypothetical protein
MNFNGASSSIVAMCGSHFGGSSPLASTVANTFGVRVRL